MYTVYKKNFAYAIIAGLVVATSSSQAAIELQNAMEKMQSPGMTYEQLKAQANVYENTTIKPHRENRKKNNKSSVKKGEVQIGLDNAGQPIKMHYIMVGDIKKNKGVFICADNYFGAESYRKQAKLWKKAGFLTISFDPIGTGKSSYNDPVAMDSIGGFVGYSYQQHAYCMHEALIKLGVKPNSAKRPITFVGLDFDAEVGILYAYVYANDPYGLSYLVLENASFVAITSDQPCALPYVNPAAVPFIVDAYIADPCGLLCAFYAGALNLPGQPGNFTEVRCQDFGAYLANQAVQYGATTPASIFERRLAETALLSPAQFIAEITIPVLVLYSGIYQSKLIKQQSLLGLYGFCFACQEGCTDSVYVEPLPDVNCKSYVDAGIAIHVTRTKVFNQDVLDFVTGNAGKCDPFFGLQVNGTDCAICSTEQ